MPALLTFAALTGLGLGPTLRHYLSMSIGSATVPDAATLTATVTQALTGYVLRTGIAFSRIEDFLFAGLVVVLRASIAALFVPVLQVSGSAIAALVCSGFILHDASRLLRCEEDHYVMAACGLYLKG